MAVKHMPYSICAFYYWCSFIYCVAFWVTTKLRLVSIISTWADTIDLLPYCIHNHLQFCDNVIIIWSQHSNHGKKDDAVLKYIIANGHSDRVEFVQLEPSKGLKPLVNETRKRNRGIEVARSKGFTHFLIADADELYEPEQMNKLKDTVKNGFVHPVRAYITPTLYVDDSTLVAGIHRLHKDVFCGNYPYYPYAYDKKNVAHIDPSRRLSFRDGIELTDLICHHYTLVRKNIDLKIDNSSANSLRHNREVIYNEIKEAKAGMISKLYHKEIKESENIFGL